MYVHFFGFILSLILHSF